MSNPTKSDTMTPELRDLLLAQLATRADRLAHLASLKAPSVVLAMCAEHVLTTSLLLLGDEFTKAVFTKFIETQRDRQGICLCGNATVPAGRPLCDSCMTQVEKDDKEVEHYLAMDQPTKGEPS